ncbi:uncharacterized protein LOC116416958 isoform X1 [Nasonia vitripennis]|uniref:Uncharacterized protein n=1 Tax=Nasonia vitripennis TaxID=7425 RepID=A0A7M7T8Z3_NASVI|nr:uncharacterized protein LOC116416958 isoform X1 [Nasonia vitripennis]
MDKDWRTSLLKKYLIPSNCSLLNAPQLNAEVKSVISSIALKKDNYNETRQQQLGAGITAIAKALTALLNSEEDGKSANLKALLIEHLGDGDEIFNMDAPYVSSSDYIRKAFEMRGMPTSALDTMIASLSAGTLRQYNKPLKMWDEFCKREQICPFTANVSKVLEFLDLSFQNCKRFCKVVAKLKPQTPKYTCTCDPDTVLQYLENLYPHESLNLEKLTKKFVTLLALITAQRVQTLSKIKIVNININPNGAEIVITDSLKTTDVNNTQPILKIPIFTEKIKVCVFSTTSFQETVP